MYDINRIKGRHDVSDTYVIRLFDPRSVRKVRRRGLVSRKDRRKEMGPVRPEKRRKDKKVLLPG